MRRLRSLLLKVLGLLVALYLAVFAVLAALGGYILLPSGETPSVRLNLNDTYVWQPRWGERRRYHNRSGGEEFSHTDALGLLYTPMISLVQHFLRPSIPMLRPGDTPGSTRIVGHQPPRHQLHPSMLATLEQMKQEFHLSDEAVYGIR